MSGLQRCVGRGSPWWVNWSSEFAGLEAAPGIWERYSTYRVGEAVIAHHKGIDHQWVVKNGIGAAQLDKQVWDDFVRAERDFVVNNHYEEQLRRAFQLAGIEYGRPEVPYSLRNRPWMMSASPKVSSRP